MDIFLLFLTSTLMSALFILFFFLGMLYEQKRKKEDGVPVDNAEALQNLLRYMTYDGRSDS